jgi:predicted N-acetyltransferase YhbS
MKKEIYVRNLEKRDLPAIVSMEERQTGIARPEYWEKRIEISEAIRPHWAFLVAEIDNRVVGFVLGAPVNLSSDTRQTVKMKCSISSAGSVLYMARCCTIKRN